MTERRKVSRTGVGGWKQGGEVEVRAGKELGGREEEVAGQKRAN